MSKQIIIDYHEYLELENKKRTYDGFKQGILFEFHKIMKELYGNKQEEFKPDELYIKLPKVIVKDLLGDVDVIKAELKVELDTVRVVVR